MRLVVGMSGATGSIYGIRLLEVTRKLGIETHLVMSNSAKRTVQLETDWDVEYVESLAARVHDINDIAACISSGSFKHDGMALIPCSIKSLSALANSFNTNLLIRAADVTLKERRKLVVVPRETPLHVGHLRLMREVAENGAILLPPMPAFYHRPKTIQDIVDQTVGKVLDQFGIEAHLFERWSGADEGPAAGVAGVGGAAARKG